MTNNTDIFDGEILGRSLARFLSRVDHALTIGLTGLNNFEITDGGINVTLTVDIGGNVSFASFGGANADRSRAFSFTLKRKVRNLPDV